MDKIIPRTLPGFMELLPSDQLLFNKIKNTISSVYERHGFNPLDTPVMEYSEVLLAKAKGETEKQIYRFLKGETDLSLRFDLTVPLAKYVAKNYNELVFPFKAYHIGKVYRGERAQRGRYREFYQCDIDIISDNELPLINDAIVPSVIYDVFKSLDFGKFIILINNRKILNGVLKHLELDDSEVLRIIDKYDKVSKEKLIEMLNEIRNDISDFIIPFIEINGSNDKIIEDLENLNIDNDLYKEGVRELKEVIAYLKDLGVEEEYYKIDLKIARGLDYYTGTVYETKLVGHEEIGSVCSGGRYDNLAEYYTDKKLPGVGMSIGLTRLFYQLKESKIIDSENNSLLDTLVIPMSDNITYSYNICKKLRENNIKTDICIMNKGFKQKMNYANRLKIKYVIIIGEDEENNNYVTVKNMQTGSQDKVNNDELINYFNKLI